MNERCFEHSGIEARIQTLDESDDDQWKVINKAHERIDSMKNWVIAGMSSLVLQLILWLITLILVYLKIK